MRLAGAQCAADLHEKQRLAGMLLHEGRFALGRCKIGITILQLLRLDEQHLARKIGMKLRIFDLERLVCDVDRVDDALDGVLQGGFVARFARDDLFPVPLIDIDRVQIVHDLVAADGVHIRDQTFAGAEAVTREGVALPLSQGMHDLRFNADVGDVKRDGALIAVEIVIQTGSSFDKQRRRHTQQIERVTQIFLEIVLDELDRALRFIDAQRARVSSGNTAFTHFNVLLTYILGKYRKMKQSGITFYYTPNAEKLQ